MIPYYATYLLLFLLNNIAKNSYVDTQKRYKFFCAASFLVVCTLLSLRHQTMGADLLGGSSEENIGYLGAFDKLNQYSWLDIVSLKDFLNYEKGYIFLNKLIGSIYNNRQFFLSICALISTVPVMILIKNKSANPLMSVVIYLGLPVFLMLFSGLRQAIAIAITVFSSKYIEEKKFIKFALLVFLSTLFHYSAIIFIIAYPLYYLKLSEKNKFFFVLAILGVYILRNPIFNIASKIFKDSAETGETGAFMLFLVFFLIYIFLIFFNKKQDSDQNGMINLFYFACICQAFGGIYQTAIRVGYYFMIYSVISIPNTIANMEDKKSIKLANILIFATFVGFGIYSFKNSTWAMTYPYNFFWEK